MKRAFRLLPSAAPYWRQYASGSAEADVIGLAQRGRELWTLRSDGRRGWISQGHDWYALSPSSTRKVLAAATGLCDGPGPRLCLALRPCDPLGGPAPAAEPWAPPAAEAAVTAAAQATAPAVAGPTSAPRLVAPPRAWSGSATRDAAATPPVRVVHKRSRRVVVPAGLTALSD